MVPYSSCFEGPAHLVDFLGYVVKGDAKYGSIAKSLLAFEYFPPSLVF